VENTSKLLKITRTSCHFLLRIIDDITDLSKIELKSFSLNNCWFKLSEVIDEVKDIMSVPITMKNLECTYDIYEDEGFNKNCMLFSDPKRLKQILFNLIGNAMKFTFDGGIKIKIGAL